MNIPPSVATVMNRLAEAGFDCYAVGGCVRDSLLNKKPHDFDLTTSATPDQMKAVFADFKTAETGLKLGTLTVIIGNENVEVTTFRVDGAYSDNRHPDSVNFARSIKEDLSRRDFTVNAFAWSPDTGLVDEFGGVYDLENRIIRCVGDPDKRFAEDALRIIRGIRFSSVFGFEVEEKTAQSMIKNRRLLENIAAERIYAELVKLLCGKGIEKVMLAFPKIFAQIIPPLAPCIGFDQKSPYHCFDIYEHTAMAVANSDNDPAVRLAALFHDIGKPESFSTDQHGVGHFYGHPDVSEKIAEEMMNTLKVDSKTKRCVKTLVKYHDRPIAPEKRAVKRLLLKIGDENFRRLLGLKKGDILAHAPEHRDISKLKKIRILLDEIESENECFSLKQLAVNGSDIIKELNIPSDRRVGEILNALLSDVVDEKLENSRGALLDRAKQLNEKNKIQP